MTENSPEVVVEGDVENIDLAENASDDAPAADPETDRDTSNDPVEDTGTPDES